MADVIGWIKLNPDGEITSVESLRDFDFAHRLKRVIAEELGLESPAKVDLLSVEPMYSSSSKRLTLHVHAFRESFANTTPGRIAERIKPILLFPADEQCVSVGFYEVLRWGKT